jgi:hypothetical protein
MARRNEWDDIGVEVMPDHTDDYGQPRIHPPGTPSETGAGGVKTDVPSVDLSSIFGKYGLQPGETDAANLAGKNPEDVGQFLKDLEEQAKRRAAPTMSAGGSGGDADRNGDGRVDPGWAQQPGGRSLVPTGAAQAFSGANNPRAGLTMPGLQFDDPYSKVYEDAIRKQIGSLTGPNQELDRLMGLISQQIEGLSNPGYSPQEMALLNTQAFEPIEQLRGQSQRNVLQRASARGVLPSSGIVEDEAQEQDRRYDQLRTVANRDLAINALNKRTTDQARAIQLAQLGLDVPNQLGQQSVGMANLLYQMPRTAMQDSLAVLNQSAPQNSIGSLLQLLQMQQNQSNLNSQQNAALWGNIGQILAGLV